MWKALVLALPLAGCITADDNQFRALLADRPTRADMAFAVSEVVCKNQARTMVQIARCELTRR